MNRNLIIAASIAAGIAAYLFTSKRPRSISTNAPRANVKSHHRTNAFSRAKQRAVNV